MSGQLLSLVSEPSMLQLSTRAQERTRTGRRGQPDLVLRKFPWAVDTTKFDSGYITYTHLLALLAPSTDVVVRVA